MWLEYLGRDAPAHYAAYLCQVGHFACGHGLYQDVAHGCGFHWSCPYGNAKGIGGELVEKVVLRAPAYDVQAPGLLGQQVADSAYGFEVLGGQGAEQAMYEFGLGLRLSLIHI